ncbi:MAG: zinc-ribbon domain-containing protein [Methylobacteriaceae bacterium]|nr:zinc-ribbon domain-containing protein [Methylobacteriaceae bacterium]
MIVVCPSCSSAYELAPDRSIAGARVRCSACREAWYVPPQDEAAAPPTEGVCIDAEASSARSGPDPYLYDDERRPAAPPPAPRRRGLPWRRIAAAAALIAAPCLAVGLRESVVARAPAAARLYAAIGLPVNLAGLEIRNVTSRIAEDGGQRVLAVSGEVTNVARRPVTPPPLSVALRGADGRALYVWTADAPKAKLAPGETATFRTRLAAPPERAQDVVVSLAATQAEDRKKK